MAKARRAEDFVSLPEVGLSGVPDLGVQVTAADVVDAGKDWARENSGTLRGVTVGALAATAIAAGESPAEVPDNGVFELGLLGAEGGVALVAGWLYSTTVSNALAIERRMREPKLAALVTEVNESPRVGMYALIRERDAAISSAVALEKQVGRLNGASPKMAAEWTAEAAAARESAKKTRGDLEAGVKKELEGQGVKVTADAMTKGIGELETNLKEYEAVRKEVAERSGMGLAMRSVSEGAQMAMLIFGVVNVLHIGGRDLWMATVAESTVVVKSNLGAVVEWLHWLGMLPAFALAFKEVMDRPGKPFAELKNLKFVGS